MSLNGNSTSPRQASRLQIGLLVIAAVLAITFYSVGYGDEEPRHSKEPTAGMKLPQRSSSDSGTSRKGSSSASSLWTTVISLAAILGCIGLVGYYLRPYLGVTRGLPIDAVELLGRRAIEQKVAIHLVRCGGRVLVLGVSPEGARTLSEITDPGEVRQLVDACRAPREANPGSRGSPFPTEDSRRA